MVELVLWIGFLVLAVFVLVHGAELFVVGAKRMGSSAGMSKFAVGVIIVGFGTSLPELSSSIVAVFEGSTEIVTANVIGSNITNILFIVGLVALLSGSVIIKRDLLKHDIPLFLVSAVLFVMTMHDGLIDRFESVLLVATFIVYIIHLFTKSQDEDFKHLHASETSTRSSLHSILLVILGLAAIIVGAKYAVDMVINIAHYLTVPLSLISITAIAIGTSLPELTIALHSVRNKEPEIAIGSIFGSNAFNALMVAGIPGLMAPLVVDRMTLEIGLPIFIGASVMLLLLGAVRHVSRWEGAMLLIFFVFFLVKLATFCIVCLTQAS